MVNVADVIPFKVLTHYTCYTERNLHFLTGKVAVWSFKKKSGLSQNI